MGFHNALIWLIIPIEVLYLLWTVINMLFGINYSLSGTSPAEIYQEYGIGLRITDIVTALAALLVAAFGVLTEIALVKRRTHGPACAQAFFVALLFVSLVYGIGLFCVFRDLSVALEPTRYQIFNVAIAVYCFKYYKPRLELFTTEAPASGHLKIDQMRTAFTKAVILFGSESEWWNQRRGTFQIILGVIFTIFIVIFVFAVLLILNPA